VGGTHDYTMRIAIYDASDVDPQNWTVEAESSPFTVTIGSGWAWRGVNCSISLTAGRKVLAVTVYGGGVYIAEYGYTTKPNGGWHVWAASSGVFKSPLGLPYPDSSAYNVCMYAKYTGVSTAKVRAAIYDCDDADPNNWFIEGETQYRQLPNNYPLGWAHVNCTLALDAGRKALALITYDGVPSDTIKVAYTTKSSGPAIISTPSSGVFRDPLAFDSTPGLDSTRSWCMYAEFTRSDTTMPDYKIQGVRFAWIPWDEGKKK